VIGWLLFPCAIDRERAKAKGDLIREALRASGYSIKAAAWDMGQMDESQLERELNGHGHLSTARLSLLPVSFWQEYALVIAHRYGLPERFETAKRMQLRRASDAKEETA
jgi:hypothetical protein